MSIKQTKVREKKPVKLKNNKININRQYLFLILILILTIIGFIYSIKNDFIYWDDDKQITDNPFIKSLSFSNISHNFFNEGFTFLPLLTYAIDYKIWGLNPYPFHVINLLIHLVNITLVFYFIKLISKRYEVALITCLLFAIHPMRVESVAWISERKDLLFALFFICSLISYYYYINSNLKRKYLVFTFIFGYLSSLSKIQAMSLPFILLIMDFFYARKYSIRVLGEKFIMFIVLFLYLIINFISPSFPYIYSYLELIFHWVYYSGRNITIQMSEYYFVRNFDMTKAPVYLILLSLFVHFIFSALKIKIKIKSFFSVRYFLFPLSVFFVFRTINSQDIIFVIIYLFILIYFVEYPKYRKISDTSGFLISLILFTGFSLFLFLTKGIYRELFIPYILSVLIILSPLLNLIKPLKFKSGYIHNFLLIICLIILTLHPVFPLLILIALWLIFNNIKLLKGIILPYIFSVAALIVIAPFYDNLLILTPFIIWFAIDHYFKNYSSSSLDFLVHKLIVFLLLSSAIFNQSIPPLIEYSGIVAFGIFYIFSGKSLDLYLSKVFTGKLNISEKFTFSSFKYKLTGMLIIIFKKISVFLKYCMNNKKIVYSSLVLVVVLFFLLSRNKVSFWIQKDVQEYSFNFIDRIFLAGYSFVFYVVNYFYPFDLSAIHSYPLKSNGFLPLIYYISFPGILLIFWSLYYLLKRFSEYRKEIIFGILFFIINISLVMHIIPIQGRLVVADRYTYLAYLGLFYINGLVFIRLKDGKFSKSLKTNLLLIFIVYLSALYIYTFNRNKVWKDSLILFNDVIEKNPDIPLAYNNRGWTKFNLKEWQGAMDDYNKAIALDSNFAGVYNNRGWLKYNMGDVKGAVADYNIALRKFSDFSLVYNNRGKAKLDLNDPDGALRDFNRAIQLNPLNSIAWCNRAKIKIDQRDFKGALSDLNRSLELNPDFSLAYYNRGIVKANMNDFKGAIIEYSTAIKSDSSFALAYNNRGWMKFKLNDVNGAMNDFNYAINIQPELIEAYNNRGYVEVQTGIYNNAIQDLSEVIKYNPSLSYAYNFRGLAKSNLKDYQGAIDDYNKAIELAPGYFDAINNRGWALLCENKINEAISDFKTAISYNKSDLAFKNLAWAYYSINNYREAINNYSLAIQLAPSDSQSYFYRGMSFFKLNDKTNACNDWIKAKNLGSPDATGYLNKYCGN